MDERAGQGGSSGDEELQYCRLFRHAGFDTLSVAGFSGT
jgi:hypothetical protein